MGSEREGRDATARILPLGRDGVVRLGLPVQPERAMNPSLFLIDGGLTQQPLSKSQVTALMAKDLIRLDAWRSEADAIRALVALKLYTTFEVMAYVDQARYQAQQEFVAQMMSDRPGFERKVGP